MTVNNSSEREVRASMRDGCAIHVEPSYAERAATESLDAPVFCPYCGHGIVIIIV